LRLINLASIPIAAVGNIILSPKEELSTKGSAIITIDNIIISQVKIWFFIR